MEGKRDGLGIFVYSTQEQYIGEWENNQRHGFGFVRYPDKSQYIGEWQQGQRSGRGIFMDTQGNNKMGICAKDEFVNSDTNDQIN